MRTMLTLAVLFLVSELAVAQPVTVSPNRGTKQATTQEEIRVKVATAIAEADRESKAAVCRTDYSKVQKEATEAKTPIVLFVGGCDTARSEMAVKHGAIPCTTEEYTSDGATNPKTKRVVIIGPSSSDGGMYVWKTLPPDVKPDDVGKEVDAARMKAGSKKIAVPKWDI